MANVNQWFGIGRLCADPILSNTPSGVPVCNFRLGTNYTYKTAAGEKRDEACYIDVQCWGKAAESVSQYCKKGSQVHIDGRLKLDQWDDKTTGQKRSKHLIEARQVQFLDPKDAGPAKSDDDMPDF